MSLTYSPVKCSKSSSIGLRHLIFDNSITIYTGSVGWYYKSMWFSLRPFITPDKRVGSSLSGALTARRYFRNPRTYLEASGGLGFSPETNLKTTSQLSKDDIYVLRTQRIGAAFQYLVKYNLLVSASLNVSHQELSYNLGNYTLITSTSGNFTYYF